MTVLSTDRFFYYEPGREYFGEASALSLPPGEYLRGFILQHSGTGERTEMEISQIVKHEGDVLEWVYTPADLPEEADPFTVHIAND